jgi:uncharacterized membrane protein YqjE
MNPAPVRAAEAAGVVDKPKGSPALAPGAAAGVIDQAKGSPALAPGAAASINPLNALRLLRSAGGALVAQATLHGELARVEWAQEKRRLLKMLLVTLLGFACLLCVMLSVGALLLAFFWGTAYRIPAAALLIALYGIGTAVAWRRFQALSALSGQSFAATRGELAADMALLRSRL